MAVDNKPTKLTKREELERRLGYIVENSDCVEHIADIIEVKEKRIKELEREQKKLLFNIGQKARRLDYLSGWIEKLKARKEKVTE